MKNRQTIRTQIVTAVVALVGSLATIFLSSHYELAKTRIQIEKDKLILSANNAHENAKEIRKRAEEYLVSLYEITDVLGSERVYVDEAKKRIGKLNQLAMGLVVYGGAELGSESLRLNEAIGNALISKSKNELIANIKSVMNAANDWYPVYSSVMNSYDNHTMPEKAEADFNYQLLESLSKDLKKLMRTNTKVSPYK